jgi:hypothetical protein
MDDQFDNRHNTGFSMTGDAYNTKDDSYNDNIGSNAGFSMTGDAYNAKSDSYTVPSDDDADDDDINWKEKMTSNLRQDMGIGKSKSIEPKKLPIDPISDLDSEIATCSARIAEIKEKIDSADSRGLSVYLINRLNKMYENKIYELACLKDSENPTSSKIDKMEKLRAVYFSLEKQKAEIEMKMMAIESKFGSEKMSIEEKDNRPDINTLLQGQDDDMNRLWALRATRRKIYAKEYNIDSSGATVHDKSDFKNPAFMRQQLISHQARKLAENNANILK